MKQLKKMSSKELNNLFQMLDIFQKKEKENYNVNISNVDIFCEAKMTRYDNELVNIQLTQGYYMLNSGNKFEQTTTYVMPRFIILAKKSIANKINNIHFLS